MQAIETQQIVGEPEGLTLEYRAVVPAPYVLARLLSAFSNTNGGNIIIGIREQNGKVEVTGLKRESEAEKSLKIALTMLHPAPKVKHDFHLLDSQQEKHKIFIVSVEKSSSIITYKGEAYYRQGAKTVKNIESSASVSLISEDLEPDSITIGVNLGNYHVEREISRGGMGIVFEAVHFMLKSKAAIKIMLQHRFDASASRRFQKEALALEKLKKFNHPGIVKILDLGYYAASGGSIPYIVMEYLDGVTLKQRLRKNEIADVNIFIKIMKQVTDALNYAHSQGVVHRDLKPENIMLVPSYDGSERSIIIDFGLAKFDIPLTDWNSFKTRTGFFIGTEKYTAPEQYDDASSVSDKADIYSLGIIIHEFVEQLDAREISQNSDFLIDELRKLSKLMMMRDPLKRPSAKVVFEILISLEKPNHIQHEYLVLDKNVSYIDVSSEIMTDMLDSILYAVSNDETRAHLNSCLFECFRDTARMVSTDGHRMSICERKVAPGLRVLPGISVSKTGLSSIKRFLGRKHRPIKLGISQTHMILQDKGVEISVALSDVQFPPYRQTIRAESERYLAVNRNELAHAIQNVCTSQKSSWGLKLIITKNLLTIVTDFADEKALYKVNARLECDYLGSDFVIGLNAKYLIEWLLYVKSEKIKLGLNDELDPIMCYGLGKEKKAGRNYYGIIMPMRL